ncbi:MAG: hypothetical protein ACYDDE_00625 [bacterium]
MRSRIFLVTTDLNLNKNTLDNINTLLFLDDEDFQQEDGGYNIESAVYINESENLTNDIKWLAKSYNTAAEIATPKKFGLIPKTIEDIDEYFYDNHKNWLTKFKIGRILIKDIAKQIELNLQKSIDKAKQILNQEYLYNIDRWKIGNLLHPKDGFYFLFAGDSLLEEFDLLDKLKEENQDEFLYIINSFDYHM